MVSKKQMLTAVALIAIAMTTIAYAQVIMGTVTLTTDEVVQSIPSGSFNFPARSAGEKSLDDIVLNFSKGGFIGNETVWIRVELAVDEYEIYEGFHSLVVKVHNDSAVKAILTLHTPYDEFEVTVPSDPKTTVELHVELIYATGAKPITDATFRLRVAIVGLKQ